MSGRQWWWLDRNSARRESGPGPGSCFRKSRATWKYIPFPNSQRKRRKVTYDKSVVLPVPPKNKNWHILPYFDGLGAREMTKQRAGSKLWRIWHQEFDGTTKRYPLCFYHLNYSIPSSKDNALFVSPHLLPHTVTTLLEHVASAQRLLFSLLLEVVLARGLVSMVCISE